MSEKKSPSEKKSSTEPQPARLTKDSPYRTRTVPLLTRAQYMLLTTSHLADPAVRAAAHTHRRQIDALTERLRRLTSAVIEADPYLMKLKSDFGTGDALYQKEKTKLLMRFFEQNSDDVQTVSNAFRDLDAEAERLVGIANSIKAKTQPAAPKPTGPKDNPLRGDTNPPITKKEFAILKTLHRNNYARQASAHQQRVNRLKAVRSEAIKQICTRHSGIREIDAEVRAIRSRYKDPAKKTMTPVDRRRFDHLRANRRRLLGIEAEADSAVQQAAAGLRAHDKEAKMLKDVAVAAAERRRKWKELEEQKQFGDWPMDISEPEEESEEEEFEDESMDEANEEDEEGDKKMKDDWDGLPY